jgi:aspartyl/asparaginyl-tRNA synthetase
MYKSASLFLIAKKATNLDISVENLLLTRIKSFFHSAQFTTVDAPIQASKTEPLRN